MPPVEVPDASIRALIRRWFPDEIAAPRIERMGTGVSTPVYRVALDDGDAFLRLGEESGERRDAEVHVHELLHDAGVPVPRILRWERDPFELDRSAVLTSRLPGRPIEELDLAPDRLATILRAAGRDLARINAIPVRGYGWVDHVRGAAQHLVAAHPTRAAWVAEYLAATKTVIVSRHLDAAAHERLTEAMRAWAAIPERPWSALAHGDADASHVYADSETHAYAGIIDFGETRGADPLYDLGHAWIHAGEAFGVKGFGALLAGYRERAALADDWQGQLRLQAIAIATRALAIQLGRSPHDYRRFLTGRPHALLSTLGQAPVP
ncbi:MAG: aminoglycoside phosphotransferase family protein [Chloroflexia bacterium]|nr:aminoglycoside phosphotransferase family protein [Chloroflexia bacterium]